MEQVLEALDQLTEDSHALTVRLLHAIHSCYRIPRLRRRLAEIPLNQFEAHLPEINKKDLTYLLAGLMGMSSFEVHPFPPTSFVEELGRYLRAGEKFGISISQFLVGSLTPWVEIRTKNQQLIVTQLVRQLQILFPKLRDDFNFDVTEYLLSHDLARTVPVFPFHRPPTSDCVMVVRPQVDLPWTVASSPQEASEALCNHFPEIEWQNGNSVSQKLCFVGVRVLSPLTLQTSQVLKKSLSKLAYQATTRVQDKERLLSLIFYSKADASLFQFNLRHYAKFSRIHHQFVPIQLRDYRKGYPGWSGFFQPDVIEEVGL